VVAGERSRGDPLPSSSWSASSPLPSRRTTVRTTDTGTTAPASKPPASHPKDREPLRGPRPLARISIAQKSLRASASRPQLGPGSAAITAWPRSLAGPILTRRSVPGLILSNRPVSRRLPFRCAARSHDRASEGKAAVPTLHRGPAAGDDPAVALDGDTVCLILAGKPD